MWLRKLGIVAVFAAVLFSSCKDNNDINSLTLDVQGLDNLGPGFAYEGWVIVDGTPVSTGRFTINDQGTLSATSFPVDKSSLDKATAFVLTIEPEPDSDPAPSKTHILAGDFSGNSASLSISNAAALGDDFTSAAGSYILATPTNGMESDELSGVWWLDPTAGPGPSLTLPTLPEGWEYEGWAVINGVPVSTGKFTTVSGSDSFNGYSGTQPAPPFPGEDFLLNAPEGVTFPANLRGMKVVISIEPSPDNKTTPFILKPLVADVPIAAADHTSLTMSNNAVATNPTGMVSR